MTVMTLYWFRLFPVRSPLLRESLLFSFPAGTEMFHFPALTLTTLYIQVAVFRLYPERVLPFGNPRIKGCLHLPEAYRSLPRPLSPPGAKASTEHPSLLDRTHPTAERKGASATNGRGGLR